MASVSFFGLPLQRIAGAIEHDDVAYLRRMARALVT
jgi:hypothetical protein